MKITNLQLDKKFLNEQVGITEQRQFETVITNLLLANAMIDTKYERKYKSFEMGETDVCENGHICGTVHCVGGWYAVVAIVFGRQNKTGEGLETYHGGADLLANDLGFEDSTWFESWASRSKDIWGNDHGWNAFSAKMAYSNISDRSQGANNLVDVIQHFIDVQSRLPK